MNLSYLACIRQCYQMVTTRHFLKKIKEKKIAKMCFLHPKYFARSKKKKFAILWTGTKKFKINSIYKLEAVKFK